MKRSDFYFLSAIIYAAPHISEQTALVCCFVTIVAAFYFSFKGE